MLEGRRGVWYGVAAYLLWGLFPLYWTLLDPASPLEILAHRIVWSLVFTTAVIAVRRRWSKVRAAVRDRRTLVLLVAAAMLISVNWGTYIYGVNSGQVVETSLGYFVNPLVSVALGVVVFRERLRTVQWVAVGIGLLAVVVLTVDYGRPPFIALTLAFSFGFYGLIKKLVSVGPTEGLAVESAVMTLPALVLLAVLTGQGTAAFGTVSALNTALLMLAGVVTAIPLLFFAAAARRVPLSTLGLLQYLAPLIQFVLGLVVFAEPMPPGRLAGFALVWLALIVLTLDLARNNRRPVLTPAV
ncbi:MAG: EamA family transporter RarD [Geodermatophilaceae bacterium]